MKAGEILKENAKAIIAMIFFAGGIATTITMQGVRIEKLEELQALSVTYAVLELKQQTLNGRLEGIESRHSTLDARVRRKLDGDLKATKKRTNELQVASAVHEQRLTKCEVERANIWKFINKFLDK